MAILTLNSSLAEQTSSSPSWDSISIPRKTASGNSCKTLSATKGLIESYGYFNPLLKYGWPDLLVTELGFHVNPKENGLQKLVQIFERDPTIGLKFFAILTRFSSLCDQTSLSPTWDSISIPRKTASKNSCKNSSAIQWWDQKVMVILTRYSSLADKTSTSPTHVWQTKPPRQWLAIPKQPEGKWLPENHAKI